MRADEKIDGLEPSGKGGTVTELVRVGPLGELKQRGCMVVSGAGHTIAVF